MEELLVRRLNSLTKDKLVALAERYKIDVQNCTTAMQLKRAIKLACIADDAKMKKIFTRLGGGNTETCIICTEPMGRQVNDVGCNSGKHFAHWSCLAKTGKEECPVCRQEIKLPSHCWSELNDARMHAKIKKELEAFGINI